MGGTCKTLALSQIVTINKDAIAKYGGIFFEADDNPANQGSLEYALAEINATLFGEPLHDSIFEKAALLAWRIIRNHVFRDGNKRTGMFVCQAIVELNGYIMQFDMELVDIAVQVAMNSISFEELTAWVEAHCTPQE